jgi:hypothetical protein
MRGSGLLPPTRKCASEDTVAALAMTCPRLILLATDFARPLHLFSPLQRQRVQGRPGGRMHPGPPRKKIARARANHRYSGISPAFPAQRFTTYSVLPGEPTIATVILATPLEPCANLAPCMGAPGPHGFAVRIHAARQSAQPTSAAFRSAFVTIAIRPLCRCGVGQSIIIFGKNESAIFLREGLDRANQIDGAGEIRFLAQGNLGRCMLMNADNRDIDDLDSGLLGSGAGVDNTTPHVGPPPSPSAPVAFWGQGAHQMVCKAASGFEIA